MSLQSTNGTQSAPIANDTVELPLAGLDIQAELQEHAGWHKRLRDVIQNESRETLRVQILGAEGHCSLGRWLSGQGQATYGHLDSFALLCGAHRTFHTQAAALLAHAQAGERLKAQRLLLGGLRAGHHRVDGRVAPVSSVGDGPAQQGRPARHADAPGVGGLHRLLTLPPRLPAPRPRAGGLLMRRLRERPREDDRATHRRNTCRTATPRERHASSAGRRPCATERGAARRRGHQS